VPCRASRMDLGAPELWRREYRSAPVGGSREVGALSTGAMEEGVPECAAPVGGSREVGAPSTGAMEEGVPECAAPGGGSREGPREHRSSRGGTE
jgi:hypothetical protein